MLEQSNLFHGLILLMLKNSETFYEFKDFFAIKKFFSNFFYFPTFYFTSFPTTNYSILWAKVYVCKCVVCVYVSMYVCIYVYMCELIQRLVIKYHQLTLWLTT